MVEVQEKVEYLGLLGINFQIKLLGELIIPNNINKDTGNNFFEEVIELLHPKYFQTMDMRRVMTIIKDYHQKYKSAPNIDNLVEAINSLMTTDIEKDELRARINSIRVIWKGYKDKSINNDRAHTKVRTIDFIKQQELSIISAEAAEKFKFGIVDSSTLISLSNKYKNVINIGSPMKGGTDILEKPEEILMDDYRIPIGTGNKYLDNFIGEGLSIGDWALILAAQGVGKSSFLIYIANNGYLNGKNVAHIIFEGRKNDIRRKHYSKLFKVPNEDLSSRKDEILIRIEKLKSNTKVGNLVIEKMKSGTTPTQVKNWIKKEEEVRGYLFDEICLDYVDCMLPSEFTKDKWQGQEQVINELEVMVEEEGWRGWFGIQAKKEANNQRILGMGDCGGSVERIKKAPLVIALGRDQQQKTTSRMNITVPKCRWARDGHVFEDVYFDGDMLVLDMIPSNEIKMLTPSDAIPNIPEKELINSNQINIVEKSINNNIVSTNENLKKLDGVEL